MAAGERLTNLRIVCPDPLKSYLTQITVDGVPLKGVCKVTWTVEDDQCPAIAILHVYAEVDIMTGAVVKRDRRVFQDWESDGITMAYAYSDERLASR